MSRTDKTRPVTVRMLDSHDNKIGIHEYHNHVKGFCDLPPRDPKAIEGQHDEIMHNPELTFGQTCHYDFSYKGSNMCGCKLCTGQAWRKEERRAKRHNSKVSLKKHTKEVNSQFALREEMLTMEADHVETALKEYVADLDDEMNYLYPEEDKIPSVTW